MEAIAVSAVGGAPVAETMAIGTTSRSSKDACTSGTRTSATSAPGTSWVASVNDVPVSRVADAAIVGEPTGGITLADATWVRT
jgi:hypothetical protein